VLFEEKERASQDSRSYIESDYEYLDRSGRAEASRVRDFLGYWVTQYPEQERKDLIARIRSRDRKASRAAVFEVVLYAVLRSIGCTIEVHPELGNGTRARPDFLVTAPDGEKFYVEAVSASEYSEAEIAAARRTDAVIHAIQKVESPNFYISVEAEGDPDHPPSGKSLRRELEGWLAGLDVDQVYAEVQAGGYECFPSFRWEHEGWGINFKAIPRSPERRNQGGDAIGSISQGARWFNVWEPIRNSVRAKGGKYGELAHPLIVAVNVDAMSVGRIDEMEGLFGKEEYVFDRNSMSAPPQMRRMPNGAWIGKGGPEYTRVSGVWIFRGVNAWNIASRIATLYFNPWAAMPLSEFLCKLPYARVEDEKMKWHEGPALHELLSLHQEWPE